MNTEFIAMVTATGLTPQDYGKVMEQQAAVDPATLEGLDAERAGFAKLNLHRVGRIQRTWKPSAELATLLARIDRPQFWMVLTEPWCGDSAQNVPCLEIMAGNAPDITLRHFLRDDNPEIMDRYLTDGKRSIPMLVAFDPEGNELFRWGSRPVEAQAVMDNALAEGLEKPARLEKLHLFYGRNRGRALDGEWVALLSLFLDGAS